MDGSKVANVEFPLIVDREKSSVEYQIPDSAFIDGIEFLIKEEIIVVPVADTQSENESNIPEWIKTNAGWWASGQIPASAFIDGIEHLIKLAIIVVPITEAQSEDESNIPEWIKTNAEWWASGQIDDKTFATGIEFLIKIGLIVV